jgi:UDP-4-amino-4,6-dideoxy-N-acetyl-beta-L-altrosamine transaminase
MIPYGKQTIDESEIQAVIHALTSEYLTTGPLVEAFEKKVASYCGARHAIAVSNGTAALHVAVLALGLNKKHHGITSPNTFLASANCMAYCGATPGFADISTDTYCIDADEMEKKITPETKLLIPVHFAGHPCEMDTIWDLAKKHNLYVIEDAAHALGSSYIDKKGKTIRVGSCTHSHLTIFSFHPVKTITTGEGGMILTNDDEVARRCRIFRNHGMEREPEKFQGIPVNVSLEGPWYYEMQSLGYNYRLTDLQCALGLAQMDRLDSFINKRRTLWEKYNSAFNQLNDLILPTERPGIFSAWHLYVARTRYRNELLKILRENGIGAHAMYIPVHLQPWYRQHYGYGLGDFPNAESFFESCIVLPLYPMLTEEEQEIIIEKVKMFFRNN